MLVIIIKGGILLDKTLKNIISEDLYRYTGQTDYKSYRRFIIREPPFKFTVYLRKFQFYSKKENAKLKALWYRLLLRRLRYKFGLWIPNNVKIGRGFYIGHTGTIVINEKAVIGDNVNISQGITIGQINSGKKQGCPVICNNVWIGTGAVVVGKIVINEDVIIAPNAFVNFDVPSHSVVIGNPGQIHYKNNATEYYIINKVG